jgi:hypothetical protein
LIISGKLVGEITRDDINKIYDVESTQKLAIFTMEKIKLLFATKWENETAKIACLIASYTSMRQGKIAVLRLQDIGEDRIYIRHS